MSIARIHVNQQVLGHNRRHRTNEPPLTTKRGPDNTYAQAVHLLHSGRAIATVRHDAGRCWVETDAPVRLTDLDGQEERELPAGRKMVRVLGGMIRANQRTGARVAVLLIEHGAVPLNAHQAELLTPDGQVPCAWIVYRPDRPLSCGARVWVETSLDVKYSDARRPACLPVRRGAQP